MKQYFWYKNCVELRPTGHLVTGNRYYVDSGTDSTYMDSYSFSVLVSWLDFEDRFSTEKGHKFDLRKM